MRGDSDTWATAVALALLDVAQRQKRPFALLAFDGRVKHEAKVAVGSQLPEDALFTECSGGTDIALVLTRALSLIQESDGAMKKADVVLITDGESERGGAPAIRKLAAEMGVTLVGLGIGVEPASLSVWCDTAQAVTRLDTVDESAAEAVFTL
jgi:uncharacterized protein with von Willebrand factor type A (vWA) domain